MSLKKIICLPDIHAPLHDETALSVALNIVKGEKPNTLIVMGDLVDFQSISRFAKRDWQEAALTADKEIASANSILDRIDKVTPKTATKVYLEGNHEKRLQLFFVQNTQKLGGSFAGISIEDQLNLDKRGYEDYVRTASQPYKIGEVGFIHGWFVNKYHANKTVLQGAQNLIYAHTHDHQTYTGVHLERDAPRLAMSLGCLCRSDQPYLESRPNNWIHGVGIIYVDDNGLFWANFIPIIHGKAVVNGKVYKA